MPFRDRLTHGLRDSVRSNHESRHHHYRRGHRRLQYRLPPKQLAAVGTVLVLERDHTYTHAATPLANGGIRRLFSLPENIQMADFGLSFYQRFSEDMRVEGHSADIGFRR